MTQIKKTLSIAGIIAIVTAPAMAEIASTAYVQNIVNNMIPQSGTVGHVLKKTALGMEWAAAPSVELKTTTGDSESASMTQKAITDALDAKLSNNATDNASVAIGNNAITIGDEEEDLYAVAIGSGAKAETTFDDEGVAIGIGATATPGLAIGNRSKAVMWGTAIGNGARLGDDAFGAIQLGVGTNNVSGTFQVSLMDEEGNGGNYTLLDVNGKIPAERIVDLEDIIGDVTAGGLTNTATGDGLAVGSGADANDGGAAFGYGANAGGVASVALGIGAKTTADNSVAIGEGTKAGFEAVGIGFEAGANAYESIAIGTMAGVAADAFGAIQLGGGRNTDSATFKVFLMDSEEVGGNYTLLDKNGIIPAERISLDSILPTPPSDCASQKCALVRDATTNPATYNWEVVRSTSSGQ